MRYYKVQISFQGTQYRNNRTVGIVAEDIEHAIYLLRHHKAGLKALVVHAVNDAGAIDIGCEEATND